MGGEPWDVAVGAPGWWRTPDACVIALISDGTGWLIDVVARRVLVEEPGVIRITEDERDGLVLLVGPRCITAAAADGVAWRAVEDELTDLKVTAIDARGITYSGAGPADPHRGEVTIDPRDGSRV